MGFELSAAQVQALATDTASVAAGKKLAGAGHWRNLGQSERALWGECQGSALYQTRVALVDLAAKCSCPSRKFPCKHTLGLLFLASGAPDAFPVAGEPEWVEGFLSRREQTQERKQARAEAAASKPVDPAAQAKRGERRQRNILDGLDQLDIWLSDLVRQGLARAQGEPPSFWDAQARRLIDAQAPALAGRVRRMGQRVGEGEAWAERLLDELGALALLGHAYRGLAQLEPGLASDVKSLIGITLEHAEVVAHGDVVEDDWTVLAELSEDDERVRVQRAWLHGEASGRTALIVQFAVASGRFAEALLEATHFRAKVAFWPSACPQRALIVERLSATESRAESRAATSIAQAQMRFAEQLGRLPWLERALFVLGGVVPVPLPGEGEPRLAVVDAGNRALPLARGDHDALLALSGGHELTLAGEWDGYELTPLVVWTRERRARLQRRSA